MMLQREIRARGLANELNPEWLPPPARATVPPNVFRVVSAESYRRTGLQKESFFRFIRLLSFCVVFATPFLYLLYFTIRKLMVPASVASATHNPADFASLGIVAMASSLTVVLGFLLELYLGYIIIAFMIGGLYFRSHSGRVLLLRPFGHKQMTLALKKAVWWYLAPFGHVITLSDRNYQPNLLLDGLFRVFAVLRFFVGPLFRPSYRIGNVKTELSFLQFADNLTKKFRLSVLSLSCGAQAFNVRTTDEWWKACINLLLNSSDIVVMDISRISAGSAWEIERLHKTGFLTNCIFIVQETHQREGIEGLRQLMPPGVQPRVFIYRETGEMLDINGFEGAMQECFNRSLTTWGKSWTARPKQTNSTMVPLSPGFVAAMGRPIHGQDHAHYQGVGLGNGPGGGHAAWQSGGQAFARPHGGNKGGKQGNDRSVLFVTYENDGVQLVPIGRGGATLSIGRDRLLASQGVTVGRSTGADVLANDKSISKRHARLSLTGEGRLRVEDLGSSNGTWKGKMRIGTDTFGNGEVLRLGEVDYSVVISNGVAPGQAGAGPGVMGQMAQDFNAIVRGEIFQPARYDPPAAAAAAPVGLAFANGKVERGRAERGWVLTSFDEAGRAVRLPLQPLPGAPETTWTVGRSASKADLVIAHSTISSQHARLRYSPERGIEVCDLGSGNGTKVDGKSVGRDYVPVTNARKIEFGDAKVLLSRG